MTDPLASVTGARQTITVVLPVRLLGAPGWTEGPYPFRLGSRVTDTATRSNYFAPACARALYGRPGHPCRWHLPVSVGHGPLSLQGMELLRTATASGPDNALAVLHFAVDGPLLDVLRAIGHRHTAGPDPLSGPLAPEALLDGVAEVRTASGPFAIFRPYTVAFLTPDATHAPALRPSPEAELPDSANRWLWQLASRSSTRDFPMPPENTAEQFDKAIHISSDWSALVLRHGAAFLGHRADTGDGDFYDFGALHARTVYLDALLLGTIQRDHINELADDLSDIFDSPRLARRVTAMEKRIARFRSTYWRQHLTAHGPANTLLLAFQGQHRLAGRFGEIVSEAADYGRLVQTQESQQISGALGVLTILGLPLGTALSILQVLGDSSASHLLLGLAAAFAVTAAALTTRYGRLVISSLRGGVHREPPA